MKAFWEIIHRIAEKIIEIAVFLLFGCITLSGAFSSAVLEDGYGQKLFFVRDSLFLNLLFCTVSGILIHFLVKMICKDQEKRSRILLVITLLYTFLLSLGWAAVSKCFPTADQASVYYGAKHFAAGNFSEITDKYSYFSCYPHQMGLALFYEILLRLFHTESYHLLQGVNAVCNVITVLSLYEITRILFPGKKVSVYFLFLVLFCLPLFWYTPFVYGELPSFAFSFLGVWMLLAGIQKKGKESLPFFGLSLLALTGASAVRKNTLILVIAVVLTLTVYLFKERKPFYLIYVILLAVFCGGAILLAVRYYEDRSGSSLNDGVPGISHLVMGLQEAEYAPGWYNGFNFETYANAADYDQREAVRISRQAFKERLKAFSEDPAYTFRFFFDKFRAEWLNTGYACYDSTAGKYYERHPAVESLYSGAGFFITRFFMDKYQFLIYFTALFFVARRLFAKNPKRDMFSGGLLLYTLPAAVLGGALFYLAWEGSGRYILPYFVMTLPYAAAGMDLLDAGIDVMYNKKSKRKTGMQEVYQ